MQTDEIKVQERKGNDAVKQLRKAKHKKGFPFMINSKELPANQCYLEYPDGRIVLVTIQSPTDSDFTIVHELSAKERDEIRRNFLLR